MKSWRALITINYPVAFCLPNMLTQNTDKDSGDEEVVRHNLSSKNLCICRCILLSISIYSAQLCSQIIKLKILEAFLFRLATEGSNGSSIFRRRNFGQRRLIAIIWISQEKAHSRYTCGSRWESNWNHWTWANIKYCNCLQLGPLNSSRHFLQQLKKYVQIVQPSNIRRYNESSGLVKRADQNIGLYRTAVRERKLYFPLLCHVIALIWLLKSVAVVQGSWWWVQPSHIPQSGSKKLAKNVQKIWKAWASTFTEKLLENVLIWQGRMSIIWLTPRKIS